MSTTGEWATGSEQVADSARPDDFPSNELSPDALPPGENGDRKLRELLGAIVTQLYGCVGSARRAPHTDNRYQHAVHEVLISTTAIGAAAAEAFLTLVSVGLEGPACVELRCLGEMALRAAVCRRRPELALELYESWPRAYDVLLREFQPGEPLPAKIVKAEKTMRRVETSKRFVKERKELNAELNLLTEREHALWSKRVHGDVFTLLQVSVSLRDHGDGDVRKAINVEPPAGEMVDALLSRASGFALVLGDQITHAFGIAAAYSQLGSLTTRYNAIQRVSSL